MFLYLMVHVGKEQNILVSSLEKEGVAKLLKDEAFNVATSDNYKFKNFLPEKWNETQRFTLKDSSKTYFK